MKPNMGQETCSEVYLERVICKGQSKMIDYEILYDLYVTQSKPMHKIADELGVAIGSVYNYLKKYEIATRKHEDTFTMKGRKLSKEQCEAISKRTKGRKMSAETKNKMSEAHKIHGIGHQKARLDGYISIYFPDHPKSTKDGYIMEHILVMEKHIGRHLNDCECVHHKNKNRSDNRIENLVLMTKSDHVSLHSKERWKERKAVNKK